MKKFLDKILDMPKLIKTIWIMLWIILVILLIFKFCFGMWYPIVVKNETIMSICNYIDNHKWLRFILIGIFYSLNFNISYLSCRCLKKYPKWYYLVIGIIIAIGISILKEYSNAGGLILEILLLLILPIILNIKFKRFRKNKINILLPIVYYVLVNLWQFLIYFVRGLDIQHLESYGFTIGLVIMFDYYIFLIISWIGVIYIMGAWGIGWLFGKDITVLRAEKEKELAKKEPDMDLVNEIDDRIAELEKEGK